MLPVQFFGQNIHFVISLFAALVFFAVFWLYFDAWSIKRDFKELVKWAGFLLLALAFVVNATIVEQSVLGKSALGSATATVTLILRMLGFVCIIIGQLVDPLQKIPDNKGLDEDEFTDNAGLKNVPKSPTHSKTPGSKRHGKQPPAVAPAVGLGGLAGKLHIVPPLAVLTIAVLYWRRATTGLERHLKPVAIAFLCLFGYETLSLGVLWRDSSNPLIAKLVASFGPVWIAERVFLLVGVALLGRWVWRYLTRRFISQLFMIFTSLTLGIFLLTTVSFTFLLVNNVQNSALNNLQTAASVLGYAIDGKKAETLANTEAIAENPEIAAAVVAKDHNKLARLTDTFLRDKKQSTLVITSDAGQVLLRAEDPDRYGDSLSSDTLIRRALIGQSSSSVNSKDGVLAPVIYIKSAAPVRDAANRIVGAAVVGLVADNAFVDGIKQATGLDSAIYAGDIRSATTFVAPDGVSRWIGVKETSGRIKDTVLTQGKPFQGTLNQLNRPFLTVYMPLRDVDNTIVGMLFIGQPQISILETASRSIELTFIVSAALMVLAVLPAFWISKYISGQLE